MRNGRLTRRFHVPSALRPTSLRIDAETAWAHIAAGGLLVDVRREDDRSAMLEGADRIAPDEMPGRVATLPRGSPIVLACT